MASLQELQAALADVEAKLNAGVSGTVITDAGVTVNYDLPALERRRNQLLRQIGNLTGSNPSRRRIVFNA